MKPITYKDNVSELVSISVKEAMQMFIDSDCKPVEVLDSEGEIDRLDGIDFGDADEPFIVSGGGWCPQIYRRENYIIGYNGEKLPPLPEGYGLVPENTLPISHFSFCGLAIAIGDNEWSEHQSWAFLSKGEDGRFACKLDSDKWRSLFPPKTEYKPGDIVVVTNDGGQFFKAGQLASLIRKDTLSDDLWLVDFGMGGSPFPIDGKFYVTEDNFTKFELEGGKWYECRDGSITTPTAIYRVGGYEGGYHCSDGQIRLPNGSFGDNYVSQKDITRAIDPELSVSLSNLDHETANKVWKARK